MTLIWMKIMKNRIRANENIKKIFITYNRENN